MEKYIIAADLTAAAFMIVLIVAMHITNKNPSKMTRAYESSLWICCLGLLFTAFSYILSKEGNPNFLVGAVNYLAFIIIDFLIASYAIYFYYTVKERVGHFSKGFLISIFTLCGIDLIFLTVGTIIGKLFTVENGVYIGGPLWDYCPIIPGLCVLNVFIALVANMKKIGKRYSIALLSYIVLVLIFTTLQLIDVNIELGYVGAAIALLISYVMIQSGIVTESSVRAEIYNELSTLDVLTGLKNRRGFQNELELLTNCDTVAGVFCDLNNLKVINDTLGHATGDKYIQKFANMLTGLFPNDFVCRISGDEFVVLIRNENKEELESKMNNLSHEITLNNDIASFGYSLGSGKEINHIIKEAEDLMYQEKDKFYKRTGKERRYY